MSIQVSRSLIGSVSIAAIALCSASAAFAQVAQVPPAADEADNATIIVTGSRIPRIITDAPNPIIAITADNIQQSGTTNVTDYLRTLPALVGSLSSYDNSGDRADIGVTGLNLLNLRNLGTDRTLVLVDGRRHVATIDGSQAVDINTIPEDLIERVDVTTGGASAIYGADGVTGVVNFIQKKNFEGLNARVQAGISRYGDAGQRLIALTAGHNFAEDRGNITLAWEHGEEDRLETRQREYLSGTNRIGFFLNSADTEGPGQNNDGIPDNIPLSNVRFFDTSRQGGIDVDFDGMPDFFGANGEVFDHGTFVPNFYQQGGSGTLVSDYTNDLLPQNKRDVISGLAHFKFSDAFEIYAEGKYAKTRSFSLAQPTFDYYLFIPSDNPYIPAAVQPFVGGNPLYDPAFDPTFGQAGVLVNRDNFDLGQRGEDITRETIRTVIGARGDLSPHLKYDLSYVFGQAKITNHYIGNMLTDRFLAAIDAVQGPNGVTCRVNADPTWTPYQPFQVFGGTRAPIPPTTFTPGSCVPLNLFGEGSPSQTAIDWITTDTTDRSKLIQHVVSGSLTGDTGAFLNLPGGPVGFAVGGEYRSEKSRFVADPLAQEGLTFGNSLGNTSGSFDVKEAFAEVRLPILADRPLFQRLELGGAIRVSDYSTIGKTTAWKVDGSWEPVSGLTLRGGYSTAVRAPNISELFGAESQTFQFIDDPCGASFLQNGTQYRVANCQALLSSLGVADPSTYNDTRSTNLPGLVSSNPDVKEEKAKTWTAGVVLQPAFLPRFVLTADWYDIKIDNAIQTAKASDLAGLCVDQPTLGNQYCALVTRQNGGPQAGFIVGYTLKPFNVANFHTAGLDVAVDYTIPTDRLGTFKLHAVGNYLHRLTTIPVPGAPAENDAYVGGAQRISPKIQITGDIGWTKGSTAINWRMQYWSKTYRYSRQTIASNPDVVAPQYLQYKARFVNDFYIAQNVSEAFQIYAGVNNVFDVKPDIGSQFYPVSAVGRYMYVGARVRLADLFR